MITLDASAVVALFVREDRHHAAAVRCLVAARAATVVPVGILARIDAVLSRRLAPRASVAFLAGIERGDTLLDCGDVDLPRIRELMVRFADLRLRFSDGAVIACAERNGGDVLTFDRRVFEPVARDVPITLLP
jgi:uncharacterized protein